ncbi:unnamed protein product [Rotaria sp. Silwood2]|nr:unnamed protein product [Rotaria sp. Silwood2]CAF4012010.1 unnamed protein product [Rotaria sp. Silwood2]CAF4157197.1 unnamed protein product [Rotaria sp. Silwood2]
MFSIPRNSPIKAIFFSSISRRLCRGLSSEAKSAGKEQQEIEEKKIKQQKYQELEKLEFRPLYLDAQATTPMDPRVLDQMLPYMTHLYGNPHSRTHAFGWESEKAIETAREKVAKLINADPKEIVFTSGATESNNIAVKGVARFYKEKKKHVVTTQTEHKCVLDSMRVLESEGFKVTYLPVKKNGLIDLKELESVLTPDTSLCSVMMVNNEIGVRQSVKEIGKLCRSKKVFFHTDAAQSVGKIPIDVNEMNLDLLSISGHKIYGPKGVGALYIRRRPRVRLDPIQTGGGQERNIRSGTVPTPLVVGLGAACQVAQQEIANDEKRVAQLSKRLIDGITKQCTNVILNGDPESRYPGCVNLSFAYIEGESLLMALKDIALSSGSACTSASLEPSYVLRAIGADEDLAHSSIRFGIGRFTTEAEIDYTIGKTVEHVKRLREMRTNMSDPICQLMDDIEGLCKRCYHLQKSNNEMYDYIKEDKQLQEYIDENEKIIEKYHRKINEIFQFIKDNNNQQGEIHWSPIAIDYKKMEEEEKRLCDEKKKKLVGNSTDHEQVISDDKGAYL